MDRRYVHRTAADAGAELPPLLRGGRIVLRPTGERTAEAAFWGPSAARFPATWQHGRAWVEIAPSSSRSRAIIRGWRALLEAPRAAPVAARAEGTLR